MADNLVQALATARDAANATLNKEEEEEENEEEESGGVDEEDEDDEDDDDDYDQDLAAEAQEIVRRLEQQLWEDINKAQAAQAATVPIPALTAQKQSRKEEAVILTIRTILSLVDQDPAAQDALESTFLPDGGGNVFGVLQQTVAANSMAKHLCTPLSHALVSLAKSEALFGGLRHSNIPSLELDKGKRRREEGDENIPSSDQRPLKRSYVPANNLFDQVSEAVRLISQALVAAPPQTLDPALVASIRLQLHQVFLFAVTSSARGGHEMHALQEISGLIQVIGVLSGIQIGHSPETLSNQPSYHNSAYPWMNQPQSFQTTDIGTAVYPCLVAGCGKTFSRLYSLRAHLRGHSTHRPFRCTTCPASFARNHDLKRHVRLHDKKAWKCGGCQKIFSRRDAIKRHKNGSKTRGPKSEICINADVLEVDLDEEDGEDSLREERRAKLWNNIAAHGTQNSQVPFRDSGVVEDGEIPLAVITNTQTMVLSLQGLLQSHVGSALGTPSGHPMPANSDISNGQATLASVIARAQLHSLPAKLNSVPDIPNNVVTTPASTTNVSTTSTENTGLQDVVMASPNTADQGETPIMPSLSMYGLSDEQAKMLELAIASAASAAQAQAEAEAALEEGEEEDLSDDDSDDTDDQEAMS